MIIGHQKQLSYLKKIVDSGKIPQALLFSGQEKLGKKKVALEFLSWLFKENPLLHPDFILIEPIKQKIQIDQIRDLSWRLSLKPIKSFLKAAIIDKSHLMTAEAQNCFLKTLEEPRGKTILILITEYPNFLFPTILSRCEIIKFYPVKKEEIEDYLKKEGIGQAQLISQISEGKPGIAIDFLKEPQKLKEREIFIKEIINLTKADLNFRFQYAKKISKSPEIKEILNLWLSYFRENLFSCLNSKVESWEVEKLRKFLERIQEVFFLISTTNINPRLALEILMLEFP